MKKLLCLLIIGVLVSSGILAETTFDIRPTEDIGDSTVVTSDLYILETPKSKGIQSIRIKTDTYEEDLIYVDHTPIEGNVFVDILVRERCNGFCKFRPYIFGQNRIRFYGLYEGKHVAFEFKRIRPSEVTFGENYFELEGKVDVYIEYIERAHRKVFYNVPIELEYSKRSEKLEFTIFTPHSLDTDYIMETEFSDINVGYR